MSREIGLHALIEAITRVSGLSPRGDWSGQLTRALENLASLRGTTVDAIVEDPAGWSLLMPIFLNAVTVRETFFLRHSGQFDYVVDDIRARLNVARDTTVSVLSAGCATGEEPYSLAIAIHSYLGPEALTRVRILASDISPEAINKARAAVYTAWAFRDAPRWLAEGYFERGANAVTLTVPAVRRAVTFEVANILHQAAALTNASIDVIFFRNVAIYLNPTTREEIYREFFRILKPKGLLIVAPADPRPKLTHFDDSGHESTSIYRARVMVEPPAPMQEQALPLSSASPIPTPVAMPRGDADSSVWVGGTSTLPQNDKLMKWEVGLGSEAHRPPTLTSKGTAEPSIGIPRSTATVVTSGMTEVEALRIADGADQETLNALVTTLLAQQQTAPTGYLIRAHKALDAGEHAAAIEDLRCSLYLRPEHRLARYWYVEALQASGQRALAVAQGRQLEMELAQGPGHMLLEDGETTAAQLLDAIRFVKEGLT